MTKPLITQDAPVAELERRDIAEIARVREARGLALAPAVEVWARRSREAGNRLLAGRAPPQDPAAARAQRDGQLRRILVRLAARALSGRSAPV